MIPKTFLSDSQLFLSDIQVILKWFQIDSNIIPKWFPIDIQVIPKWFPSKEKGEWVSKWLD